MERHGSARPGKDQGRGSGDSNRSSRRCGSLESEGVISTKGAGGEQYVVWSLLRVAGRVAPVEPMRWPKTGAPAATDRQRLAEDSRRPPERPARRSRASCSPHRGVGTADGMPHSGGSAGGFSRRRGSRTQPRGGGSPAGARETGSQHRGDCQPQATPAARIGKRIGGTGHGHRTPHSETGAVPWMPKRCRGWSRAPWKDFIRREKFAVSAHIQS